MGSVEGSLRRPLAHPALHMRLNFTPDLARQKARAVLRRFLILPADHFSGVIPANPVNLFQEKATVLYAARKRRKPSKIDL